MAKQFIAIASEGDAKRDAGLKTPRNIQRFDNIKYGKDDAKYQLLDVYRPKNKEGKLPVILSVHGGGWVYGDKDVYQFYCMSLAQRGFAVVNYSYRLAPDNRYPAAFEDAGLVMTWILKNAKKYGFDTENIFAVGDSAGGNILSTLACVTTNPKMKVPYTLPEKFKFKGIALNCGCFDMDHPDDQPNDPLMEDVFGKRISHKKLKEISAVYNITENYPPVFVMTCPGDFLFGAPDSLIPVLKQNKVPFLYRVYGDKDNPLAHVFHCDIRNPFATVCNDDECAFFKSLIK